jgi:hypothetical protein
VTDPGRGERLTGAVRAVLEAKQEEARREREARLKAERRARRQPFLIALIVVGWGLLGWLWITRPDAVFHPGALSPAPARDPEAAARFALYLERARLVAYHDSTGVWAGSLSQVGQVEEGVRLSRSGPDFALEHTGSGGPLVLTRRMDADSFLGNALARLTGKLDQ